jgi:hypothetical protein
MTKVFFGGSRKLGRLNKEAKERADNIISQGYLVLVGDANGADRAMQQYLAEKSYTNVLVFCPGGTCRNNVGSWEVRSVAVARDQKDFHYYAARDKQMSDEADYGFMLWDGKSKGTLNNIVSLLERDKTVLVYFSPKKEFYTLKARHELDKLLAFCDRRTIEQLDRALNLKARIHPDQSQLKFG